MGFKDVVRRFENKKLALEQKQTARLNQKRLKLKAKYEREKVKDNNRKEIMSYEKKLSGFKENKKKKFGSKVMTNLQKNNTPNPIFSGSSGSTNSIYTTSSGSNPYDFSGSSNKKKSKKKRGKTITIRL